ncbi:MAG: transglycosylase domain-containing protein, partial [Desulfovermiculus sp.]
MRKFFLTISMLLGFLLILGLGAGLGVYLWVVKDLPQVEQISDYRPSLTTTVYTQNDEVLGYLAREKRFLRSLDEMDEVVPKCFLAAEDHSFYEHEGIDLAGILRAAVKNIKAGSIVQGGSTITQQVIKDLLLTPERSYERKLKEAVLAYRLEKNLDKDEILTIYLNEIYLGHGAYGVEAAARVYFGKHVDELSLAEASLLAGLPKAPSLYDPY